MLEVLAGQNVCINAVNEFVLLFAIFNALCVVMQNRNAGNLWKWGIKFPSHRREVFLTHQAPTGRINGHYFQKWYPSGKQKV